MTAYKLVPVEPTDDMINASVDATLGDVHWYAAGQVYEAMLAAAPEVGWQPIETAPMDGAAVLLYYGEDYYVMEGKCFLTKSSFQGRGSSYKWVTAVDMGGLKPTHWMPLPLPPKEC